MPENIHIEFHGLKELDNKLRFLGKSLESYLARGSQQAGKEIIQEEGLQKYPPSTEANQPPTPYYIRGKGTQYKNHNDGRSENYGKQFHVDRVPYGARIANRASYAMHLAGENQAKRMGEIGWRKLIDVAKEKLDRTREILSEWVNKAMKDANLK